MDISLSSMFVLNAYGGISLYRSITLLSVYDAGCQGKFSNVGTKSSNINEISVSLFISI